MSAYFRWKHKQRKRFARIIRLCWFVGHESYELFPDACRRCDQPVTKWG